MRTASAIVFGALLLLPAGVRADQIVNGSFEDGLYDPVLNGSWVPVSAGQTKITGWTIGAAGVDWHQNSYEIQNAFAGTKMIDLNRSGGGLADTGTLSQSFATTVSGQYLLRFHLAGPYTGFPDPRQVRVDIAGITQIFSQAASNNLALVWGEEVLPFSAIGTTTTLTFSSVNGTGYWGPFLDAVSVEPAVAVPEPAGLISMTLALCGAGGFLRARRLRRPRT